MIVCDAGTGIAHLREEGFQHLLPESGEIHLLLSHLHLDHTVGLSFLPALWSNPTAWIRGHEDPEQLKAGLNAHTSAEGAARVARDAGVEELLLSHLTPLRNDDFHQEMLATARAIFPRTHLCRDGLSRLL